VSFDLFFIPYHGVPPTVAVASQLVQQDEADPAPEFDLQRASVIKELIAFCPEYEFTPSAKGPQYGGAGMRRLRLPRY
jgi:hypothetical protein